MTQDGFCYETCLRHCVLFDLAEHDSGIMAVRFVQLKSAVGGRHLVAWRVSHPYLVFRGVTSLYVLLVIFLYTID